MKRVANLYGIMAVLIMASMFFWKGFSVHGYLLVILFLIVYYGENILHKLDNLRR